MHLHSPDKWDLPCFVAKYSLELQILCLEVLIRLQGRLPISKGKVVTAVQMVMLPGICRDDPTILAWSLANEPRCEGDYSGSSLQVCKAWCNV